MQAKKETSAVRLVDVVTSTTAAPYYFPPNKIEVNGRHGYTLVDGGLAANNPLSSYQLINHFYFKF